jgi:hypothetical protein
LTVQTDTPEPNEIGARGLLREIGNEFQRRGWQDPSALALKITQQAQSMRKLDADVSASLADQAFLVENGTTVVLVQAALAAVFDGRSLLDPAQDQPLLTASAHGTHINIGNQNTGVTINVGGQQVASMGTPRDELLRGIEAFLEEAFDGSLDEARLLALDHLMGSRKDIDQPALEAVVSRVVEKVDPSPSKLAQMRNAVMASAGSSLLVQAILTVVHAIV